MGSVESMGHLIEAWWWLGPIVLALILSVRGNIPVWLGIAVSGCIFFFFSQSGVSYTIRSALSTAGHAFLGMFR
jgi:threonine/homoserine efflux transporter RhtA